MPDRPNLLTIAALGLVLASAALGQSHTVRGNTLVSMKGVTDPNAMNEAWQTALMAAAFNFDEKLVKDLIERKANVNVGSRFGMTALMYARGLPVVKLLLDAGAPVKAKDINRQNLFEHYAAQRADPEVVQALIEAGASVDAKDDKGMSAPHLAKLELLSSENLADKGLHDAYKTRVQKVIDLLVASGAREDHP